MWFKKQGVGGCLVWGGRLQACLPPAQPELFGHVPAAMACLSGIPGWHCSTPGSLLPVAALKQMLAN